MPGMKERFILILSASGGAGHLRAAEALHRAAGESELPLRTENHDCLDFTSRVFKNLYAESYLSIVNRAPELWGYFYKLAEHRPYTKKGLLKLFDQINYKRYLQSLIKLRPDAILCTHFLPFISISHTARKAGLSSPFFAATTDFDVHQYWVDPIVEKYYVYHEESAWQLDSKGVQRSKIFVKGIPLMPEFRETVGKERVRSSLEIEENRFTLLILSGGFGVGRVEEVVKSVSEGLEKFPAQEFTLLVVCGKNERAQSQLSRVRYPGNVHAKVFGFVKNIHQLMEASDLLISKSGGLTSAEAMAKSLPMIVIDPIPGQETRNADLIIEHGAGLRAINLPNLVFKLQRLIERPDILLTMRRSTAAIAKPNAAMEILQDVYESVEQRNGGKS